MTEASSQPPELFPKQPKSLDSAYAVREYSINKIKGELHQYFTTFMAGIFRFLRYGDSSILTTANVIIFNFFQEKEAFSKNQETGKYHVNDIKLLETIGLHSKKNLMYQGNGDYESVPAFIKKYGKISTELQKI